MYRYNPTWPWDLRYYVNGHWYNTLIYLPPPLEQQQVVWLQQQQQQVVWLQQQQQQVLIPQHQEADRK